MPVVRVLQSAFIIFGHAATAIVHLWWNDLAKTAIPLVKLCLASPAVGILEGIVRLHLLVLLCFAVFSSFRVTSTHQIPTVLTDRNSTLTTQFDDIQTVKGWADVPSNYSFLEFRDFFVFKPSASELNGLISTYDLNCAVSTPNALYGARPLPSTRIPTIHLKASPKSDSSTSPSFTLHSLHIKPLDMPVSYAEVSLRGLKHDNTVLLWNVDFPAGFHDMLNVDIELFTGEAWNELLMLEVWSDFHHAGTTMDWEFCIDDLKVSLQD